MEATEKTIELDVIPFPVSGLADEDAEIPERATRLVIDIDRAWEMLVSAMAGSVFDYDMATEAVARVCHGSNDVDVFLKAMRNAVPEKPHEFPHVVAQQTILPACLDWALTREGVEHTEDD